MAGEEGDSVVALFRWSAFAVVAPGPPIAAQGSSNCAADHLYEVADELVLAEVHANTDKTDDDNDDNHREDQPVPKQPTNVSALICQIPLLGAKDLLRMGRVVLQLLKANIKLFRPQRGLSALLLNEQLDSLFGELGGALGWNDSRPILWAGHRLGSLVDRARILDDK